MSTTANPVPVLSLSEGFGAVVVQGDKIKVEILANGNINVQTVGHVRVTPPHKEIGASIEPLNIGEVMPDGSVYAGVSPGNGRSMFTTPEDAPLTYTFNDAGKYASNLDNHGHSDWRVPTKAELDVLFQSRFAIGGFNTSGLHPSAYYWSSSNLRNRAVTKRFSDGSQIGLFSPQFVVATLRCVRG